MSTPPAGSPQAHAKLADLDGLAPSVQRLVIEHHLDPKQIEGTGRGGRITKEDVLRHLDGRDAAAAAPSAVVKMPSPPQSARRESPGPAPSGGDRTPTRERMSPLRLRLAERLVQVQQTSAILTTFNEVDMSRVMALRARYKERFGERHEVALGFMSFFVKAAVDALRTVPQVHASIEGDEIVRHAAFDIGIAVSSDKGLVVPVVRDADRLSMAGVERAIADLAEKARARTLTLSDLTGATFTISNGGVFGSMMSTPILNPPGSAILGMHAITKRPVVVDDEIVIRPMMYLALSYDHRLIDGREAVTFLKRIVDTIEDPDRLLLEV
jgi:2-oxoglutarate dehydrogenase E2 component (dihydrolipoamide succinyltransferase)